MKVGEDKLQQEFWVEKVVAAFVYSRVTPTLISEASSTMIDFPSWRSYVTNDKNLAIEILI